MKLLLVALAIFYRKSEEKLEVWTQTREDDGVYQGLLEFPGGKVEAGESPLEAAVREVEEEVGISIGRSEGSLMGIYKTFSGDRTILLNVFLFPPQHQLDGKGTWLSIERENLSSIYQDKIPKPNHQIIDDLFRSLYS